MVATILCLEHLSVEANRKAMRSGREKDIQECIDEYKIVMNQEIPSSITYKEYKGSEIYIPYNSDYYYNTENGSVTDDDYESSVGRGNLWTSCMRKQSDFQKDFENKLMFYVINPKQISIAAILINGEILARCVVYTNENNERYNDTIYVSEYNIDNVLTKKKINIKNMFLKILRNQNINELPIRFTLKVDTIPDNNILPYMDNMKYGFHKQKLISNSISDIISNIDMSEYCKHKLIKNNYKLKIFKKLKEIIEVDMIYTHTCTSMGYNSLHRDSISYDVCAITGKVMLENNLNYSDILASYKVNKELISDGRIKHLINDDEYIWDNQIVLTDGEFRLVSSKEETIIVNGFNCLTKDFYYDIRKKEYVEKRKRLQKTIKTITNIQETIDI